MKETIARMLAAVLSACVCCTMLFSCSQTTPPPSSSDSSDTASVTQPVSSQPEDIGIPTIDQLLNGSKEGWETITDEAYLKEIWKDYLYLTTVTIFNPYGFSSVEEISRRDLCNYFYYQMQRQGDTTDVQLLNIPDGMQYGIPVEKLETYCIRYFGSSIDFAVSEGDYTAYYYDAQTGLAGTGDDTTLDGSLLEAESIWNNPDSWPGTGIVSCDRIPGGYLMANCVSSIFASPDEYAQRKFLFQEQEDGSLVFLSAQLIYPETNLVSLSGSYETLPYQPELKSGVLCCAAEAGTFLTMQQDADHRSVVFSLCNYQTGETGKTVSVPLTETSYYYIRALIRNDQLVLLADGKLSAWDLSLNQTIAPTALPIAAELLSSADVSADLNRIAYVDDAGIQIYDRTTDQTRLLKNTAPYLNPENEVKNEGYSSPQFVENDSKIFVPRFGYEWTAGYLLYDLATDEGTDYPYIGSYGRFRANTSNGCYLMFHSIDNETLPPTYLSFSDGSVREAPELQPLAEYGDSGYWQMQANGQHWAWLASEQKEDSSSYQLFFFHADNQQLVRSDFELSLPSSYAEVTLCGITENGDAVITIEYLGEQYTVLVKSPISAS